MKSQQCGLEECLTSPGPFTVFCPDDDAFAQLAGGKTRVKHVSTLIQQVMGRRRRPP